MPPDVLLRADLYIPPEHNASNLHALNQSATLTGITLAAEVFPSTIAALFDVNLELIRIVCMTTVQPYLFSTSRLRVYLQSDCESTRRFFDNVFASKPLNPSGCSRFALLVQTARHKHSSIQSTKLEDPFITGMDNDNTPCYPLPPISHFLIYAERYKNLASSPAKDKMIPQDSSTPPRLVIYAIQLIDPLALANVYQPAVRSREHMKFHDATSVAREIGKLLRKVGVMDVGSDGMNIKTPDVYRRTRVGNQGDNIDQSNKDQLLCPELKYLHQLDAIHQAVKMKPARTLLAKRSSSTNVNGGPDDDQTSVLAETKYPKRVKISAAPVVVVEDLDKWEVAAEDTIGLGERTSWIPKEEEIVENGVNEKAVVKARGKIKKKEEGVGRVDDDGATLTEVDGVNVDDGAGKAKKQTPGKSRQPAMSTPPRAIKTLRTPSRTRDKEETHEPENKKLLKNMIVQALKARDVVKGEHEEWKKWYTQVYQSCQFVLRKQLASELICEAELRRIVDSHLDFYNGLMMTVQEVEASDEEGGDG